MRGTFIPTRAFSNTYPAFLEGCNVKMHFRKLTTASRLLLMTIDHPLGRFLDRFPIGDFHRLQDNLHAKFACQFFAGRFEVDLSRSRQNDFRSRLISFQSEGGVLLEEPGKRAEELVFAALYLRFHSIRNDGRERLGRRVDDRLVFSARELSPVPVSLSLGIARMSPATAVCTGCCFLPSRIKSCPNFSLMRLLAL